MMSGQPSRTLLGTAIKRAEHQLLDAPLIFADPIVLDLVSELADPAAVAEFRSLGEPFLGLLRSFGISLPRLTSSGATSTRLRPRLGEMERLVGERDQLGLFSRHSLKLVRRRSTRR